LSNETDNRTISLVFLSLGWLFSSTVDVSHSGGILASSLISLTSCHSERRAIESISHAGLTHVPCGYVSFYLAIFLSFALLLSVID
jgi:hypothetical protein